MLRQISPRKSDFETGLARIVSSTPETTHSVTFRSHPCGRRINSHRGGGLPPRDQTLARPLQKNGLTEFGIPSSQRNVFLVAPEEKVRRAAIPRRGPLVHLLLQSVEEGVHGSEEAQIRVHPLSQISRTLRRAATEEVSLKSEAV
mmetsp:Transcript_16258/g.32974  ORF Transcript_16258/g.32974 Transcript_16258/m.32974 type:complete len:145 (-) Transcript_16258:1624-2058(-)